ncbi:MAG: hypothetical protein MUF71_18240 [Candidatus Kapabacteria bacterium]|jgi:hypothetical protein|nr:hypothetical protein [Candidatus Kapabacteria bacterium]
MGKIIIAACVVIAAIALGIWVSHGSNIYTKDKVQVVVKTVNPNFGTEEEHIEWKDEFHLGLDIAGPISGVALLSGLGCYVFMRRKALHIAQSS